MESRLYLQRVWQMFLISCMWVAMGVTAKNGNFSVVSDRSSVVNVGAMFTFNSAIGRSLGPAIFAAIEDVNSDSIILKNIKLNLIVQDTNCSGLLELLKLAGTNIAAALGPQSSGIAHVISHVMNELHVPLLSFATDPTLSSLQYSYFLRAVTSDHYQMYAIADLVDYFGWREVVAIFVDDDYGRNGISVLGDSLASKRAKISYKAAFPPGAARIAKRLGMMSSGYVWIATDWLPSVLDSSASIDPDTADLLQGVVALRHYTPDSDLKTRFSSRWGNIKKKKQTTKFNSYALYGYDSVWLLARALDSFFNGGGTVSFSDDPRLRDQNGSALRLTSLQIFDQGPKLLQILTEMNFTGLTGKVQFDSEKNLITPAFDILNIGGTGSRRIGYWSNYSGLSTVAPETLYTKPPNTSKSNQHLYSVIWPGETTTKPRGWVFPNNGKPLQIAVPYRVTYPDFVTKDNGPLGARGFCIDVFEAAVQLLPYPVPHQYILYGDGRRNPSFGNLVNDVAQMNKNGGLYTTLYGIWARCSAPVKETKSSPWSFLMPFTWQMWAVTGIFFLFVGSVVWILEHRMNTEFRGPPRQQLVTVFWRKHGEHPWTVGADIVAFVVLIINSSYTASLTSILTVQQLSSGIRGIDTLIASSDPIGIQDGSFAYNYLIHELNIAESRIRILKTQDDYVQALQQGPGGGGLRPLLTSFPMFSFSWPAQSVSSVSSDVSSQEVVGDL
ncbi:UNVERIFIED_CONTAM: Glutamate receptor 3.5 [Sesamum angustifolium]|uniref:Glutamate receptor 3.5 n=1 Tax=Sesamum angustifolium TaxID=2727405 RepID=A0AAW2KXA6_9LAMI